MISLISALAAGNAIQLYLTPPSGAVEWRVLRKRTDDIVLADPAANVVYEGEDATIVDRLSLVNGTAYFYRVFYQIAGQWIGSPSRSVTPAASFTDLSCDVVDVLLNRIDAGMQVYVDRGQLRHSGGHIPVMLGTPEYENAPFPFVTIHVNSVSPDSRFIGDSLITDVIGSDGDIDDIDGWLQRYQIGIVAWTLNGDVRALLRKALFSIVQANFPVFASAGMSLVEATISDNDDMQGYPLPVYQAICSFSCVAQSSISIPYNTVTSTTAELVNM